MKRQRQENNVCCLLIFWGICWDFANREQGMAYKVKKYQGKLGSHLQEESLGHSCISETDLPCSLPCIRNLVFPAQWPEVIEWLHFINLYVPCNRHFHHRSHVDTPQPPEAHQHHYQFPRQVIVVRPACFLALWNTFQWKFKYLKGKLDFQGKLWFSNFGISGSFWPILGVTKNVSSAGKWKAKQVLKFSS